MSAVVAPLSSALAATAFSSSASSCIRRQPHNTKCLLPCKQPLNGCRSSHRISHSNFILRVTNESSRTEVAVTERTEGDKMVDKMDFGERCNEFECISSPLVESTAGQLVPDG